MSSTSGIQINPLIRRLVDSLTGDEVDAGGFERPLGLSPSSGKPLEVEYDLAGVADAIEGGYPDEPGLRRYAPLLPVCGLPPGYVDDVGRTVTTRATRLGDELGIELHYKHEGSNPTGSFKDRGLAIGIALGVACGAKRFCLPTQGNAGVAAAFYSSRLGLEPALVYMPEGYQGNIYHRACALFGGEVRFVGPNIATTGKHMREDVAGELERGEYVDLSTFFEPGRLEGKKTMGLEIAEHFGDALPDWILYPTGGGTGLVGIHKAFTELRALGRIASGTRQPRMVVVQSEQCAPVVRSFERGLDAVEPVTSKGTVADGLDVPGAIMGHRMLRVLRESEGTAVAVGEDAIRKAFADHGRAGISAGYESAALLAALRSLRERDVVAAGERVLIVSTSGPFAGLAHAVGAND